MAITAAVDLFVKGFRHMGKYGFRSLARSALASLVIRALPPLARNDSASALHRAFGHVFVNHLRGDYIEFGVYRGDSFVEAHRSYRFFRDWLQRQLQSDEPWRREVARKYDDYTCAFHGLDTFGGMPDNDEGSPTFGRGTFLSCLNLVRRKCEKGGLRNYTLYEGLFLASADAFNENMKGRKAAIINIDCDLYGSAVDALKLSLPYIQCGTVLLFDDWNCFNADENKGERAAFRDVLACSSMKFEAWFPYQYSGQAFLCVSAGTV